MVALKKVKQVHKSAMSPILAKLKEVKRLEMLPEPIHQCS